MNVYSFDRIGRARPSECIDDSRGTLVVQARSIHESRSVIGLNECRQFSWQERLRESISQHSVLNASAFQSLCNGVPISLKIGGLEDAHSNTRELTRELLGDAFAKAIPAITKLGHAVKEKGPHCREFRPLLLLGQLVRRRRLRSGKSSLQSGPFGCTSALLLGLCDEAPIFGFLQGVAIGKP
ncbi:MAG TPA: hypothetical protein VKT78_20540 [Fimbriimonadaceae bacterium]|nr:hypothetical protein [Fimbriimonadaceae bacterium]